MSRFEIPESDALHDVLQMQQQMAAMSMNSQQMGMTSAQYGCGQMPPVAAGSASMGTNNWSGLGQSENTFSTNLWQ